MESGEQRRGQAEAAPTSQAPKADACSARARNRSRPPPRRPASRDSGGPGHRLDHGRLTSSVFRGGAADTFEASQSLITWNATRPAWGFPRQPRVVVENVSVRRSGTKRPKSSSAEGGSAAQQPKSNRQPRSAAQRPQRPPGTKRKPLQARPSPSSGQAHPAATAPGPTPAGGAHRGARSSASSGQK